MSCSDYEELLSAYASNELSRTQREFIEEHLSHCAKCQKTLAGYIGVGQHLSTLNDIQLKPDLKEAIMSKIKGENAGSTAWRWIRPALVSITLVAILATIFIVQPWNSANSSDAVLASVKNAIEDVRSYRVVSSSSTTRISQPDAEPTAREEIWEFVLPDLVHVTFNNSYNSTDNGVVTRMEETSEFFIIGENLYSLEDNDMDTFPASSSPFSYTGGVPSKESVLGMLQFIGELEQLPDESIEGVECLHYKGTPRWGSIPVEIWIGKDDYLIRQISQINETKAVISTYLTKYYDFNADITIEPPVNNSGELLPGWEVESIESATSLIPVDEAIGALTGDEVWSDPDIVREIAEMMNKVRDPWAYFYALPTEAQDALIDFLTKGFQTDVTTVTQVVSAGYSDDGIFHYSNNSIGLDVVIDTGEVSGEGEGIPVETTEIVSLWVDTVLAPDPQAYFDALSEETRGAMVSALSDNSILSLIIHALD